MNVMNKTNFEKWVGKMYKNFNKSERYHFISLSSNVVICYDKKTTKTGVARCHPDDTFVYRYGVAIAYAHLKGYCVPNLGKCKKMNELKNGDIFTELGHTYRYIGKISKNSHAVVDMLSGRLEQNYNKDEKEVEICS